LIPHEPRTGVALAEESATTVAAVVLGDHVSIYLQQST
jgi:hypothetical protein